MTIDGATTARKPSRLAADAAPSRVPPPRLEWVDVAGEIVAWHEDNRELHLLDPIASLIFRLCDGRTSLAQTTEDLARAFGETPSSIASEVLGCAGQLCRDGLLEVSRRPRA